MNEKQPRKKTGRPKGSPQSGGIKAFEFTDEIIKKIESLAMLKFSKTEMQHYLGVSEGVWYRNEARNPKIQEAINRGSTNGLATMTKVIYDQGSKGNLKAASLYVKTFTNWGSNAQISNDVKIDLGHNKTIQTQLPSDPIEAARIYRQIMLES